MPDDKTLADIEAPSFPRGSLLRGLLDRNLMMQADRGNSSAMVGERWADIVSTFSAALPGSDMHIPGDSAPYRMSTVLRLDDDPSISHRASASGLQNPDFLFIGHRDGTTVVQAADAKFSVETARSKQVSEEVVSSLLDSGITDDKLRCGDLNGCVHVPGVFLSPDGFLTKHVLHRGRGIRKVAIDREELVLVDASSRQMFDNLEGYEVSDLFWRLDKHPYCPADHLAVGLYYFRLARASVANWQDEHRPLLELSRDANFGLEAFLEAVSSRSTRASNAWELVRSWSADADVVREQRQAITGAIRLPISHARLREIVVSEAASQGVDPPSINKVRRDLGRWLKSSVHDAIGPIPPPVGDLDREVRTVERVVRGLKDPVIEQVGLVVEQLSSKSNQAT